MGELMEIVIEETRTGGLVRVTDRQLDVIFLIGRDGLSYKAAAVGLSNQLVRVRNGIPPPHLSHHTVRRYANEIRDLFGLDHLSPMRAMWVIYQEHRETLEDGV